MVNGAKGVFEVNVNNVYILVCEFASSSGAISNWICLEVLISTLNPSWLSCNIWYLSPYVDRIEVNVFV